MKNKHGIYIQEGEHSYGIYKSKQDEIREGVKQLIRDWQAGFLTDNYDYITDAILKYEELKGVVLKVDEELPYCSDFTKKGIWCPYIDAGYGLFEPLIKEVINESQTRT